MSDAQTRITDPGTRSHKCKVQPRYASLGYPFHNTAAHT